MLGGLFKSGRIDAFAHALADELAPRLSAAAGGARASRDGVKQMESLFAEAESRAIAFSRELRLGVYGKARLCNSLRWRLTEQGADATLLATAMERIVAAVSRDRG